MTVELNCCIFPSGKRIATSMSERYRVWGHTMHVCVYVCMYTHRRSLCPDEGVVAGEPDADRLKLLLQSNLLTTLCRLRPL